VTRLEEDAVREPGGQGGKGPGGPGGPGGEGGTLYVVATPIGNLGDVTLRALETLRIVPLIAAEDTRHTHRLLERHGIRTRTTSYHARSGPGRVVALLDHLRGGSDLALVTDAGTPGVSDPGAELVAAWAAEGGTVVPLPGASAVLAAVAGAGVSGPRWVFEGFLPRSGRDRRERLARIAADDRGTVIYEAPGRIASTLADLAAACGPDRQGAVCRELTKLHETITRAPLGELAEMAQSGIIPPRGEFAIVVGMRSGGPAARSDADEAEFLTGARAEVDRLIAAGASRSEAARRVAAATGLPRRRLYAQDAGGRIPT
jgi:16S rRNA (cytidine1402-2'-O)-methyltransferase